MIIGIVAVDKNWCIGKKGGLLFKLPKDMRHFKAITDTNPVAMGENTLLSFPDGKPLKNRLNIVLCQKGHEYPDCKCVHSFNEMLEYCLIFGEVFNIYIIGGGMFYKSMLPYYDRVIVTKVDAEDKEGTVFFPNLDEDENFNIIEESEFIMDNGYGTQYVTYERIKK